MARSKGSPVLGTIVGDVIERQEGWFRLSATETFPTKARIRLQKQPLPGNAHSDATAL